MSDSSIEPFSNEFGSVLPDRVAFNVRKNWLSGTIMEEYAIRHITSIRVENSRKPVLGAILLLVGMAFMANGGAGILFGLLIGALGVLFLIGSPSVTLNTAGGEKVVSSGSPFQRGAGEAYAAAVRKALFPS